jgi:hypothetical protein
MASTKFTLNITAADGENPIHSARRITAQRVRAWFAKRLNGAHQGSDTVECRTGAVQASAIVTAAAVQSGDTVTVNGQALTATSHTARGTATCVSVAENDALTVAGVTFTVKDSPSTALEVLTGGTDTLMAAAFAAAINANATTSALVKATNAAGVVHIKALATGTGGNSIGLSDTGSTITVSAANLAGGAAVGNNEFDFHAQFNNDTATALAAAVNASTTAIVNKHVTAAASSAAVTLTATIPGHAGNAVTIATSNGTRLAITGSLARLAGGTETLTTHTF